MTIEGDEFCTRRDESLSPVQVSGWKINFIRREAYQWIAAKAELKNAQLFENGEGSIR